MADRYRLELALDQGYFGEADGSVWSPSLKRLTPFDRNGYLQFQVRDNEGTMDVPVHQFQAYLLYGNELFDKYNTCVRHMDDVQHNNRWDNLKLGSSQDNRLDIPKERRRKLSSNSRQHDHAAIIADRAKGMTYQEIMDKYNIPSKGTVSYIIKKSMELE